MLVRSVPAAASAATKVIPTLKEEIVLNQKAFERSTD
jgi:hypothetical protein